MSKYGAKKVIYDGITFDSQIEKDFYKHLINMVNCGEIKSFELQPMFILQPKFEKEGKKYQAIKYIADFKVYNNDGTHYIVDIKGVINPLFSLKEKMFHYHHKDKLKLIGYSKVDGGWIELGELKKNRKVRKTNRDAENAIKLKEQQLRESKYMDTKSLTSVEYIAKDIVMSDRTRKSFIKHVKENYQTIEHLKVAEEKDMHKTYKTKIKQLQSLLY